MSHEQNLLSLPWHLLAKKRAGTATTTELAELADWLAQHAPVRATASPAYGPGDKVAKSWQGTQALA
jgi:hypothetical protein